MPCTPDSAFAGCSCDADVTPGLVSAGSHCTAVRSTRWHVPSAGLGAGCERNDAERPNCHCKLPNRSRIQRLNALHPISVQIIAAWSCQATFKVALLLQVPCKHASDQQANSSRITQRIKGYASHNVLKHNIRTQIRCRQGLPAVNYSILCVPLFYHCSILCVPLFYHCSILCLLQSV